MKVKIRKGDTIEVIAGANKFKRGEVIRVLPTKGRVVVQGVNLIIKHQRRTGDVRTQFGRIEMEAPIHASNVMLVCPSCKAATRVGFRVTGNDIKVRYCKRCDENID